jgi:hypothetical protein
MNPVETNKSQYEVFAIIGELSGSGCPLGYLLIKADPKSEKGGKQKYLEAILGHLRDGWEIYAATTLLDKNWSEINACLKKFSEGKHQLCYWHALRAVKQQFAVRKRQPAPYDWREACRENDYIDKNFRPIRQADGIAAVSQSHTAIQLCRAYLYPFD